MRGKDLLNSISDVDNDLIAEAEASMTVVKKRSRWKKWIAVAACIFLAVGGILAASSVKDEVVYAEEMDSSVFFSGKPMDKVAFMTDFSKYGSNTKVRVMLIAYEMEENYPEIYGQKFDGKSIDELMDEYLAFVQENEENYEAISKKWSDIAAKISAMNDEMSEKEMEWLEFIGAEDIQKVSYNKYLFTIKKGNLEKIQTGNCKYRVIMASEEYVNSDITPEDLFGEYECVGMVHVPIHSSVAVMSDAMDGQKLVIGENTVSFGDDFVIADAKYEIDTEMDKAEKFYGFESVDFMFMHEELVSLFANKHVIINVTGSENSARIFAGDGYVYLDRGLWGIYKFKAVN